MGKTIKLKNNIKISDSSIKYESGMFTPSIKGSTADGTATYDFNYGYYTKIGNICFYDFKMSITSFNGAGGLLQISGIPYSDNALAYAQNSGNVMVSGDMFGGNTIRQLWFGDGMIISDGNNSLGGLAIINTTSTNYIYGTGMIFINE